MLPTDDNPVRLYAGDCLKIVPTLDLSAVDAVVTDPPWGINMDTDYTRFTGGLSASHDYGTRIAGDETPFDPAPWLAFPKVALWGANCFAQRLPVGRWLVWVKKRDSQLGTFMSDAEVCWINKPPGALRAPGVYVRNYSWHGFDREGERGKTLHPTQKPVQVMRWTLEMAEVPAGGLVLDPYMGSGTTGVACVQTGRRFIGIELDSAHFAMAQRRINAALGVGGLFPAKPAAVGMFDHLEAGDRS